MKIVLVTEFFPTSDRVEIRGGVENRCFNIARHLAGAHQLTVVTSRAVDTPDDQEFAGFRVRRVGPRRGYTQSADLVRRLVFFLAVAGLRLADRPDIVDAQAFMAYLPGYILARRHGAAAVMTIHDSWRGQWRKLFGLTGWIGEVYERLYLRLPWDGVIANSRVTLDKIMSCVAARPTAVVHNGIGAAPAIPVRPEPYRLCVVSRLVKYKRVEDVLEAVARLRRDSLPVTCTIVGSGPEAAALKQRAADLDLGQAVMFTGFVARHDDVLNQVAAAKVFCLPSAVEGFGIVTIEAAAVGRPYVSSDIPATREATRGGQGGLLYPVGDVNALTDALRRILTDQSLYRQKQGELAGLVRDYDWSAKARETEAFYHQLRQKV